MGVGVGARVRACAFVGIVAKQLCGGGVNYLGGPRFVLRYLWGSHACAFFLRSPPPRWEKEIEKR